jgi:hypothetical protein
LFAGDVEAERGGSAGGYDGFERVAVGPPAPHILGDGFGG